MEGCVEFVLNYDLYFILIDEHSSHTQIFRN